MDNPIDGDKKNIVKLAHLYFQNGQWDKALAEYRKIIVMDPDDMNTQITLGDIYVRKNALQVAYEYYSKAAHGLLSRGQMDRAIVVYKRMMKLDTSKLTEDARNHINSAQYYVKVDEALKNDNVEESIEGFGKLLKFRPEDPLVQTKLLELDGKIAQMPVSVERYQILGDLFLKNDIYERAQEMFKKISDMDPQDVSVRSNLAKVYLKQGSDSEAKKEYLSIAEEAFNQGQLDQAFEFAQKAIVLKSVEAYYILGLVYFKRQKWMEARGEFEKLLRIKINHLGALTYLGRTFDLLNQPDKAVETFNKALQVDKNDPQVQEAWIEFCVKYKDKQTALPYLTVLLDKAISENDAEKAVRFSKIMTQLDSELVLPHIKLVQMLQKLGDFNGAADACCALALIYDRRRNYAEAVIYLEKALELSPANAEILEKVLMEMKQKALPTPPPAPTLTVVETPALVVEKPLPVSNNTSLETELAEMASTPPKDAEMSPQEMLAAQLATADQCIKQGLLKAAIEIYQELLQKDSNVLEFKKVKLGP